MTTWYLRNFGGSIGFEVKAIDSTPNSITYQYVILGKSLNLPELDCKYQKGNNHLFTSVLAYRMHQINEQADFTS